MAKAAEAYDRLAFHEAAAAALALSSRGNLYLQETTPWTVLKKVGVSIMTLVRTNVRSASAAAAGMVIYMGPLP